MVKYGGRVTGMTLTSISFWKELSLSADNFRKDKDCRKDCKFMGKRSNAYWLRKNILRKKFSLIKQLGIW